MNHKSTIGEPVSRSGYYEWLANKTKQTHRQSENTGLKCKILKVFKHGRDTYGTRRIKKALALEIEVFYNRQRLHSANDYMSPADYEIKYQNHREKCPEKC